MAVNKAFFTLILVAGLLFAPVVNAQSITPSEVRTITAIHTIVGIEAHVIEAVLAALYPDTVEIVKDTVEDIKEATAVAKEAPSKCNEYYEEKIIETGGYNWCRPYEYTYTY